MKKVKVIATLLILPVLALAGIGATSLSTQPVASSAASPASVNQAPGQAPATTIDSSSLAAYQSTLEQIYQQVDPSVVSIQVIDNSSTTSFQSPQGQVNPFGNSPTQQGPSMALGSGFVWDTQGDIVTNNHVIAGASQIQVTFADGTTVPATLVGADLNSDLAVIKVNVPASELHPVTLMNSDQVKVGQMAIAIGNPYGLSNTMTTGIISGLARSLPVGLDTQAAQTGPTYSIPDIIQTDAPINPGNSGGVLVNDQGQLMGVTAAIESPVNANSGIGFVIPSNIVNQVVPSLIKTGKYQHPYLGISGTSLTPAIAQAMNLPSNTKGALVVQVSPGGPAANAGLQGSNTQATIDGQPVAVGGDVITAINGQPVTRFEDLSAYLFSNTQVGQTVTLTILRNGQQQSVQVTLGTRPSN